MTENPIKDAASGGYYDVGGSSNNNDNGDNAGTDDPLASFRYAMKSKDTEKQSFIRLRYFFNGIGMEGGDVATQASNFLAQAATKNRKYTDACIFNFSRYLKDRYDKKELKGGTVRNYLFAVKLFHEVNDIEYDWRQIKRGLPVANYIAHDRAPTLEEIRKLITNSDLRIKVIVLIMLSSGIRVSAFDYLKLKHVIPIENEKKS